MKKKKDSGRESRKTPRFGFAAKQAIQGEATSNLTNFAAISFPIVYPVLPTLFMRETAVRRYMSMLQWPPRPLNMTTSKPWLIITSTVTEARGGGREKKAICLRISREGSRFLHFRGIVLFCGENTFAAFEGKGFFCKRGPFEMNGK